MKPNLRCKRSPRHAATDLLAVLVMSSSCTTFWSRMVSAEDEVRSADVAAARELAIEGLKLADAGQCAQALDKLGRAEKLHHAPIVLGRLGECEIAEGRLVDGTENLRKLLREPLPSNPTVALAKARDRAQAVLDTTKPRIATLTISIREPPDGVSVTIDGEPVPPALFDRGRPTDPGEHVVEATAPGFLKTSRHITLSVGGKEDLLLSLSVDPDATAKEEAAQAAEARRRWAKPGRTKQDDRASTTDRTTRLDVAVEGPSYAPSYVLWSVGAAAAGLGGVFGYLALKGKNDLDKQCVNNSCPPELQSDLDSARRNGLLSTVLLGSGGGVIAVGTLVYLLTGPSVEKSQPENLATARPFMGLGRVGLTGEF